MTIYPSAVEAMAGKFFCNLRGCTQATEPLKETVAIFRRCVTQGIRCSASSPEAEKTRFRIGDLTKLCKTVKTHGVPQLFNQLRDLPEKHLENSVNSALYWFLRYNKIEEAFELKTLMEKHGIRKSYSTYSGLAVLYSKCKELGNMTDFFNEMARDGLTPRARHYAPFVEAAAQKGDLLSAFDLMHEMQHSAGTHDRNTDVYTVLIRACAEQQNRQLTDKVLEIFQEFRKYRESLNSDTLEAIKLWFDSQVRPKWKTSWSSASVTFRCQACQQKLETGEFSASELEELKHPLANHLWRDHKSLPRMQCDTSAGKYIDHFQLGQLDNFPTSIEEFVRTTGLYDVVIDGLNVAYFKGFFDPRKVALVVAHFVKQNKRVLVMGSSPMKLQSRSYGVAQTSLGILMDYLTKHEQCGVFCLKESSIDDLYFLSAAMHCGPGTRLVSRDKFCNHINQMDPYMRAQFRRWQNLYQMVLDRFIGNEPVFVTRKPFDAAVQTTGDTWHFPSGDGNRWLCVKRQGILT